MQRFTGFLPETIDFLWELRMNNNKEWMDQNRERYKKVLKDPFERLAADLSEEFSKTSQEKMDWAISRINRDIRYSKDKSPYRACRWVVFKEPTAVGTTWKTRPVFYFELSPEGYTHGIGFYESKPAYMKAFRKKIEAHPEAFTEIVKQMQKKQTFHLIGKDYKRIDPSQLPMEIQPWYEKKNFAVVENKGLDELIFTQELPEKLVQDWKCFMPLYHYLKKIKVD